MYNKIGKPKLNQDEVITYLDGTFPIKTGIREYSYPPNLCLPAKLASTIARELRREIRKISKIAHPSLAYTLNKYALPSLNKKIKELSSVQRFLDRVGDIELVLRTATLTSVAVEADLNYGVWITNSDKLSLRELRKLYLKISTYPMDPQYPLSSLFHYIPTSEVLEIAKKIVVKEGKMLEYPSCCINDFVSRKLNGMRGRKTIDDPEEHRTLELMNCEDTFPFLKRIVNSSNMTKEIKKASSSELPYSFYSFPYLFFYPCTIKCKEANKIGRKLEEQAFSKKMEKAMRFKYMITPFVHITIEVDYVRRMKIEERDYPDEVKDLAKDSIKKCEELSKQGISRLTSLLEPKNIHNLIHSLYREN